MAEMTKTLSTQARVKGEVEDYLLPGRPAKLSFGFDEEYLQVFKGSSDLPKVEKSSKTCYRLSGGELEIDVRTDRYIWGILDYVYSDGYLDLATCDVGESDWYDWGDGSYTPSDDEVNQRYGDACKKLEIEESVALIRRNLGGIDLSAYSHISFFLYIEDILKFNGVSFQVGTSGGVNYYEISSGIDSWPTDLHSGWNEFWIDKDDCIEHGTISWDDIDDFIAIGDVKSGETSYFLLDVVRACKSNLYPQRVFDIGLQSIPTAWWAGNTALYEIKVACEAEGARFYSDEYGGLHFENRQHYNLNDEYKSSKWGFTFDNMTDLEYPTKETDLINNVIVKLKPRKVVAEKEIWRYGFTPSIGAGETKEIWASLIDPCLTTAAGIVSPVATTDYTANTQEDGGGTDKTAQIDIDTTKFANAVLMEVTNNDAGAVYLTLLKLRGTPAEESDEVNVKVEDATSIATYGKRPSGGLVIENKYLDDEDYAETRAQQLIDWYKDPKTRIVLKNRCVPQLQLGDMIGVSNEDIGYNYIMRVTGIKSQFSNDGLNQEIYCRSVLDQETLSYFEIGASEIGGTDVIAP